MSPEEMFAPPMSEGERVYVIPRMGPEPELFIKVGDAPPVIVPLTLAKLAELHEFAGKILWHHVRKADG